MKSCVSSRSACVDLNTVVWEEIWNTLRAQAVPDMSVLDGWNPSRSHAFRNYGLCEHAMHICVCKKGKRVCFRPLKTRQQKPLETQRRLFEMGEFTYILFEDMALWEGHAQRTKKKKKKSQVKIGDPWHTVVSVRGLAHEDESHSEK